MATEMLQYLDPDGLDETVLNIGQIKTILERQISDLEESIEEEMQDLPYARPDGLYPDMTVGAVIGADETAQWATRESAGSGAATVRSVQGAAVVWNQICNWFRATQTVSGMTFTNNGDGSVTLSGTATADAYLTAEPQVISGHKYMFRGCPQGGSASTYYGYLTMRGFQSAALDTGSGNFGVASQDGDALQIIYVKSGTTCDSVTFWPQLFDLTAIFGTGNEPTTVEEFERMYPADYYPYSAPTLQPVRIAGIESTDANGDALDGVEWETQTLRAAGSVADMLYSDHVDVRVGVVVLTGAESLTAYNYSRYNGYSVSRALPENGDRKAYSSSDFGSYEQGAIIPNTNQFAWLGVNDNNIYLLWADCPYATSTDAKAWLAQRYAAGNPVTFFYALNDPTTTPISPALPMTYRVEQGGTESIVVPDGEVSAAPVLTIAEPVNAGDEFARIWAAIESLGYTRNTAQLSRPISLTDVGSVDEVQKEAAEVAEIDTVKEVQE